MVRVRDCLAGAYLHRPGRRDLRLALDALDAEPGVALHRIVRLDGPDHALHALHDLGEVELGAAPRGCRVGSRAGSCESSLAERISAFDGTQPVFRQSPPMRCFSTSVTFAFTAAAM